MTRRATLPKTHQHHVLLGLLGLWMLTAPSHARASCAPENPAIVWSYPFEGATEVPVDAHIFLMLDQAIRITSITVNGVVVNETAAPLLEGVFDPGPLTPNTAYLVTTMVTGPNGPVTLELTFTTGTATATGVDTPTISNQRLDPLMGGSVHICPSVFDAQSCVDTGQDAVLRVDVSASATLYQLWSYPTGDAGPAAPELLATWPGECGAPSYVTHSERFESNPRCLRVTSVGANGETAMSNFVCPDEPFSPTDSGCAVGTPNLERGLGFSPAFLALAALAALCVRRRVNP